MSHLVWLYYVMWVASEVSYSLGLPHEWIQFNSFIRYVQQVRCYFLGVPDGSAPRAECRGFYTCLPPRSLYCQSVQFGVFTLHLIHVLRQKVIVVRENSSHFVNLLSLANKLFSPQLKINKVIQQPTVRIQRICWQPLSYFGLWLYRALLSVDASNIDEQWQ